MDDEPRMIFVQDALPFQGGAEKVLEAALEAFPNAGIATLIYRKEAFHDSEIGKRTIRTSPLNRLPGAQLHHRSFFPLMPFAIEHLDVRRYDVIVSFSYAVAHGVRPEPGQLHVSYMHTTMRYAWQASHLLDEKLSHYPSPVRWVVQAYLHAFRHWDITAASRVHRFLTVSEWMSGNIWRAYHRPAEVLYPPVDVRSFQPLDPRGDRFVTVSRLVAHKRVDLIVEAFNRLGYPLDIIGDGPELPGLRQLAGPNVHLLGWLPKDELSRCLGQARAFIHAGEEDFGIAMAEAQAAGCPVIAFGRGAAREIIREEHTGILFMQQTADALGDAVNRFTQRRPVFDSQEIRQNAQRFDRARFVEKFAFLVRSGWQQFQRFSPDRSQKTFLVRGNLQRPAGKG